jgi:hypothetical protein
MQLTTAIGCRRRCCSCSSAFQVRLKYASLAVHKLGETEEVRVRRSGTKRKGERARRHPVGCAQTQGEPE